MKVYHYFTLIFMMNIGYVAGNHWDDVITRYKEVDLANYKIPENVDAVFEKIRKLIKKEILFEKEFLTPHVIDLAKDGRIGKAHSNCRRIFWM
jgi:hypothetical protein